MFTRTALSLALILVAVSASAQEKRITTADFGGVWNVELMSHQVALVIEPVDDTHVTAVLTIMDRDTALKGDLKGKTLTLVGMKSDAASPSATAPTQHGRTEQGPPVSGAKPITVTLEDDGTISGELMSQMGAAKFTGEKLKTRKKG